MKRIIELSDNDYKSLKEEGVQNHIALADTIIARSMPYEPQKEIVPVCQVIFDKEQLQEIVDKTVAELVADNKRPEDEWIPVSERTPDDRVDTYWVCTEGGYQCQCRWTNVNPFWTNLETDWHWCHFDIPQYQEVIAWQPLPEPYKEGGAKE